MSEQPTAAPGGGKKIFGLPRNIVIIGGITFVAVLGYLWWKRAQSSAAATTASASTTAATAQQPTDYAGQLSVLQTELEALLAGQGQAGSTTGTGTGTTATGTPVIMSLPDGSGGWEQVKFPSQSAVDAWTAWNQGFVNNNNAQASRSQWNSELTSLGVTRTDGQPLAPPSTKTGNPYDAR